MPETNNNMEEIVEINLTELVWSVLRHWRGILLGMLILGLLLGGFSFLKGYGNLKDEEMVKERSEAYRRAVEEYEMQKTTLEKQRENLQMEKEILEEQAKNSIMLSIDQYNVYVARASYYVNTHYEIAPQQYYQNPDYTAVITNNYRLSVRRLSLDEIVASPEEPNITARNPISGNSVALVNTDTDTANGVFSIMLFADTQEHLDRMFDRVKETIRNQEKLLNEVIGEHSVGVLLEEVYTDVETAFGALQDAFDKRVETNQTGIRENEQALEALEEPVDETPTMKAALGSGIKSGLIGLFLGLVLMLIYHGTKIILQNRLNSAEELKRRYQLPVLGVFGEKEKQGCRLDQNLRRKLLAQEEKTPEEAARYIASHVKLQGSGARRLLLVGTCSRERLELLKNALEGFLSDMEISAGGNVNESFEALNALAGNTAVVCVEAWLKASHRDIRNELDTVKASGNQNIGFIMLA